MPTQATIKNKHTPPSASAWPKLRDENTREVSFILPCPEKSTTGKMQQWERQKWAKGLSHFMWCL